MPDVPLVKCNTCAHDRPCGGCAHPDAQRYGTDFWTRADEADEQGRPWCHSGRGEAVKP